VEVDEGRAGDAVRTIGMRTDDDDREHSLIATNDVVAHVADAMVRTLPQWGLQVADDARLVLDTKVTRFHVSEKNEAVGAVYRAEVRLEAELEGPGGDILWSGSASGDASRYGRKFSADNANEVLSDALLEAMGAMLRSPRLQEAWSGGPTLSGTVTTSAASTGPLSPSELLREVQRLKREGLADATIESWVERQELTAPLSADDLAEWKRAEVPESVIRVAVDLPVR
jgi:hypothetical protein